RTRRARCFFSFTSPSIWARCDEPREKRIKGTKVLLTVGMKKVVDEFIVAVLEESEYVKLGEESTAVNERKRRGGIWRITRISKSWTQTASTFLFYLLNPLWPSTLHQSEWILSESKTSLRDAEEYGN